MDFKKHLILQSNGYTDIMKSYSVCSLAAKALAARKCPASCTRISKLNNKIIIIIDIDSSPVYWINFNIKTIDVL